MGVCWSRPKGRQSVLRDGLSWLRWPLRCPLATYPMERRSAWGSIKSGALPDSEELRLLPGWRSPDALAELSFGAVRRVLLDLADGNDRATCRPVTRMSWPGGVSGVLLGLRIDWAIPVWEEIAAGGGLPEEPDEDAAEMPMRYVGLLCSTVGEAASSRRARAACRWMLWHFLKW